MFSLISTRATTVSPSTTPHGSFFLSSSDVATTPILRNFPTPTSTRRKTVSFPKQSNTISSYCKTCSPCLLNKQACVLNVDLELLNQAESIARSGVTYAENEGMRKIKFIETVRKIYTLST